jgi:hypothetical protein
MEMKGFMLWKCSHTEKVHEQGSKFSKHVALKYALTFASGTKTKINIIKIFLNLF